MSIGSSNDDKFNDDKFHQSDEHPSSLQYGGNMAATTLPHLPPTPISRFLSIPTDHQ